MSHPIDRLSVNPIFYDALSREFRPGIDVQGYAHSLGRIAQGAIELGTMTQNHEDQAIFNYEPSWAPNVLSLATCAIDLDTGQFSLTGLALAHSSGLELTVHQVYEVADADTPFDHHVGVAIADGEDYIKLFQSQLPESLPSVSTRVVGYANKFFSNSHISNISS